MRKIWMPAAAVALSLTLLSGCSPSDTAGSAGKNGQPVQPGQSSGAGSGSPSASEPPSKTPPAANPADKNSTETPLTPEQAKKEIAVRANEVVTTLKNKDLVKLQTYVHPKKGLRISPYSNVNVKSDLVFQADQVGKLLQDTTTYTWGTHDGSGAPIAMKFADYYGKFLYDLDYAKAEKIGYNETLGKVRRHGLGQPAAHF